MHRPRRTPNRSSARYILEWQDCYRSELCRGKRNRLCRLCRGPCRIFQRAPRGVGAPQLVSRLRSPLQHPRPTEVSLPLPLLEIVRATSCSPLSLLRSPVLRADLESALSILSQSGCSKANTRWTIGCRKPVWITAFFVDSDLLATCA